IFNFAFCIPPRFPMTQAYALLVDNVNLVRKSWQIRRVLEGVVLLLAAAGGALLLGAMLDTLFDFGSLLRCALFLAFLAAAGYVIAKFIWKPIGAKHSDDFFAALIEQRHPNMRNRLINALQLGRATTPQSPRLVEAIVNDGAHAVDELDANRAVSTPAIKHF